MNNRPIFIVGAARSGTTLLQYMLKSHPDLSLPTAESHFFIPFYQCRTDYGDLSDIGALTRLLEAIYDSRKLFSTRTSTASGLTRKHWRNVFILVSRQAYHKSSTAYSKQMPKLKENSVGATRRPTIFCIWKPCSRCFRTHNSFT